MLEKVKAAVEKYNMLHKGDRVLAAVSGGPDSIALLHCLWSLREEYELSLFVFHLNHCLRGKEAELDARLVQETADKYHLPCYLESVNIDRLAKEKKLSFETCARNVRQELYLRYAAENSCGKIALGHNADDQAETVLMRFLRGTGSRGLCGIAPVKEKLIRPLIEVSKSEIEAYCQRHGLVYRIDSTNLQPVYLRNKIRLDLLPLLEKEYNSNMRGNLLRQREIALEDQEYWDKTSEECLSQALLEDNAERILLNWAALKNIHRALLKRVLLQGIARLQGNLQEISFADLNSVLDLLLNKSRGKQILHEKLVFEKSYNQLCISLLKSACAEELSWRLEVFSSLPENKKAGVIYIPFNPELGPLELRCRLPGDKLKTSYGTKKLKKFLNEKKVPSFQRDKLKVVAQNERVLWLEGFGSFISKKDEIKYAAISLAEED